MNKKERIRCIGLTGGIASGKSTVSAYLKKQGYCVLDADEIAHRLMKAGGSIYEKIRESWGEEYVNTEEVNRGRLAERIFRDSGARERLDSCTHPLIYEELKKKIAQIMSNTSTEVPKSGIIFLDIPLLYESSPQRYGIRFDQVWVVFVNAIQQKLRLMRRNHLSEEEAQRRMAAQMSLEKKCQCADVCIDNSTTPEALYQKVQNALEALERH